MFHNFTECVMVILKYIEPVMVLEQQAPKQFSNEMSEMQDLSIIPTQASEILKQENSSYVTSGGWCHGDSWFGSVNTCVTLK